MKPEIASTLSNDETEVDNDFTWAMANANVHAKYAGRVVAVYREEILADGATMSEALQQAKKSPDFPGRKRIALVSIPQTQIEVDS